MIIKHLLLIAALEPLNMQIWFNDPFLMLHHYSFWDIINLAKGGDYPLEHVKNVGTFLRKMLPNWL
jgi:hypothetical protein